MKRKVQTEGEGLRASKQSNCQFISMCPSARRRPTVRNMRKAPLLRDAVITAAFPREIWRKRELQSRFQLISCVVLTALPPPRLHFFHSGVVLTSQRLVSAEKWPEYYSSGLQFALLRGSGRRSRLLGMKKKGGESPLFVALLSPPQCLL